VRRDDRVSPPQISPSAHPLRGKSEAERNPYSETELLKFPEAVWDLFLPALLFLSVFGFRISHFPSGIL
jgi:hypothetical protein